MTMLVRLGRGVTVVDLLRCARARLAYRRIRDGEPIASGCVVDDCEAPLSVMVRIGTDRAGYRLRYACAEHALGANVVRSIACAKWLGIGDACACGVCGVVQREIAEAAE